LPHNRSIIRGPTLDASDVARFCLKKTRPAAKYPEECSELLDILV
jgi:hypothetical protein